MVGQVEIVSAFGAEGRWFDSTFYGVSDCILNENIIIILLVWVGSGTEEFSLKVNFTDSHLCYAIYVIMLPINWRHIYPISFLKLCHHNNGRTTLFPDHSPKVTKCLWQCTLQVTKQPHIYYAQ